MFIFRILLFLCFPLFAGQSDVLFDESKGPSQALLDILDLGNIPHDSSWESIINQTQKLVKTPYVPSIDLPTPKDIDKEQAYCLFQKLGVFEPQYPICLHYDYALVLGSSVDQVTSRLLYLKKMWEQGIRFDQWVLLAGYRQLTQKEKDALCESVGTEVEMIKLLLRTLDLPETWHQLPLTIIDAPPIKDHPRATTVDTLYAWLATNPDAGSALFVSSQPFIARQDALARKILPNDFIIETIGPGVSRCMYDQIPNAVSILYQNLYWWLYAVIMP